MLKQVEKRFPEVKIYDDDDNYLPQIREKLNFGYDKFDNET